MPRWTPEARAKQAAKIRAWKPWQESTGPKTQAGKARSSQNAVKAGLYSRGIDDLHARVEAYLLEVKMLGVKKRKRIRVNT